MPPPALPSVPPHGSVDTSSGQQALPSSPRSLPPLRKLTDAQRRGADCVDCATPLRNRAAVDLGARRRTEDGQAITIHPRRCAAACRAGGAQ